MKSIYSMHKCGWLAPRTYLQYIKFADCMHKRSFGCELSELQVFENCESMQRSAATWGEIEKERKKQKHSIHMPRANGKNAKFLERLNNNNIRQFV